MLVRFFVSEQSFIGGSSVMGSDVELILASASPRRRELLEQIAVRFHVHPVHCDEAPLRDEEAHAFVNRLALDKAKAGWQSQNSGLPVLGSDTAVVVDGHILGKPEDASHAEQMLRMLSGRAHQVMSGVAIVQDKKAVSVVQQSTVFMRRIDEAEIHAYWRTGEPADKAGGYAVQGLGAVFIERIEGSYSGVMGLPLYETAKLLEKFGIPLLNKTE